MDNKDKSFNNCSNNLLVKQWSKILDIKDNTLNYIECLIKNNNYQEIINNIVDYESLINFINYFKWKKEKLDFIYFEVFTKQLIIFTNNLNNDCKMQLYKDIFWECFQLNPYDEDWHIFSSFMNNICHNSSKKRLYIWKKLLKKPISY